MSICFYNMIIIKYQRLTDISFQNAPPSFSALSPLLLSFSVIVMVCG